ncbi:MAG: helix-turn-helix transcriptional regulator [Bacteroidales bacterium]|jgi:DNA-binding NarL/FixJ family response regulator|nr:helix-turn-helix transcriptional regulator [Bacteroidales bacterium]
MKTEICIIHNSHIIQKGLEALIEAISPLPCTIIKHPSDLHAFQFASQKKFIIFAERDISQEYHQALHKINEKNTLFFVQIIDENQPTNTNESEYIITHYSDIEEIAEIIESVEKEQDTHKNEIHENNENLTIREKEILKHVAMGFSNKEIAEQLFISVHTVITHRKNIVEKTGIKSISGLTMYAIMTKIINPDTIDMSKLI